MVSEFSFRVEGLRAHFVNVVGAFMRASPWLQSQVIGANMAGEYTLLAEPGSARRIVFALHCRQHVIPRLNIGGNPRYMETF